LHCAHEHHEVYLRNGCRMATSFLSDYLERSFGDDLLTYTLLVMFPPINGVPTTFRIQNIFLINYRTHVK